MAFKISRQTKNSTVVIAFKCDIAFPTVSPSLDSVNLTSEATIAGYNFLKTKTASWFSTHLVEQCFFKRKCKDFGHFFNLRLTFCRI